MIYLLFSLRNYERNINSYDYIISRYNMSALYIIIIKGIQLK